ncbi:MAG: ankyrin repeat domain-containing protein [Planctomycetaceae bacterium]|nr:ankyrin repeat domain-containing protein [Planctomycetaceae bacterium]
MSNHHNTNLNTPEQQHFFRMLATGDVQEIRASVTKNPALLDSCDYRNFGGTPLTIACFSNRPTIVNLLLELGADPNRKSDWPMGPWSPLHCALFHHDRQLVQLLISRGALVDVHTAAGLGDCDAVRHLLDADPSRVNERGGDGCQPLHFADTIEVAKLLLDRGAQINGRCIDHYSTPVQYLCTIRPEVARFLLRTGAEADIFSAVLCGNVESIESLLLANSIHLNARINQTFFPPGSEHDVHNIMTFSVGMDATPLHAAAKGNCPVSVAVLVKHGMSPNIRGGYDHATPLHTAAWSNCLESAQSLLEHGAEIDARSGHLHNNTPAGWAIVAGSDRVFALLMDRGATVQPWFLKDAREACEGRFDPFSCVPASQREKIFARVNASQHSN